MTYFCSINKHCFNILFWWFFICMTSSKIGLEPTTVVSFIARQRHISSPSVTILRFNISDISVSRRAWSFASRVQSTSPQSISATSVLISFYWYIGLYVSWLPEEALEVIFTIHIQSTLHCVSGIKRPEHEADHSFRSGAEADNTASPHKCNVLMGQVKLEWA
jgi:hypothetical protein